MCKDHLLNSALVLDNATQEQSEIKVRYDFGETDYIALTFKYQDKAVPLHGKKVTGNAEEYFHLNKTQVGFLIEFLKNMHNEMTD